MLSPLSERSWNIDFDSRESLARNGFKGFKQIDELRVNLQEVPPVKGIYIMLYTGSDQPGFLENGSGGWFKEKDPNEDIDFLEGRWVHDAIVVYVGMTDRSLRQRISEFLKFGNGHKIGHRGGRLVWQIQDRKHLALCWKTYSDEMGEIREIERAMIAEFAAIYGKKPFANIIR
jgi:hypothetical protein